MRVSALLSVDVVEVSFTTESAVNVLRKSGASMNTRTCTWVVFQAKYPVKSTVRRNWEMQVHLTFFTSNQRNAEGYRVVNRLGLQLSRHRREQVIHAYIVTAGNGVPNETR